MKQIPAYMAVLSLLTLVLWACQPQPDELVKKMIATDDMQQFNLLAGKARSLGRDSIPIFSKVLDQSFENRFSLLSYGKVGTCLTQLHELAKEGIYSIDEVPVLVKAMRNQIEITGTLVTAEILTIITGLNVGYSEQYVKEYRPADEPERQAMIDAWEQWYKANK